MAYQIVAQEYIGPSCNHHEPRGQLVVVDHEDQKILAYVSGGNFRVDGGISNAFYVMLAMEDGTFSEKIDYFYKTIYKYNGPKKVKMMVE